MFYFPHQSLLIWRVFLLDAYVVNSRHVELSAVMVVQFFVLLITFLMALSSVTVGHDSVIKSQHAQHQDPETKGAKLNSVNNIIDKFFSEFLPLLLY